MVTSERIMPKLTIRQKLEISISLNHFLNRKLTSIKDKLSIVVFMKHFEQKLYV